MGIVAGLRQTWAGGRLREISASNLMRGKLTGSFDRSLGQMLKIFK
jgi:hypothetical protein